MTNTKGNIFFLAGIKHSGKSSLGRYVAKHIISKKIINYVDLDDIIIQYLPKTFTSIRSFYENEGKEAFMQFEASVLETYLNELHMDEIYIISLGGGACDNVPLVKRIRSVGTIIYLSLLEETLLQRIKRNGIPPFLDKENVNESFHPLFLKRDEEYRKISDFVVSLADFESIESNGKTLTSFITQLLGDTTWAEIPLEHH